MPKRHSENQQQKRGDASSDEEDRKPPARGERRSARRRRNPKRALLEPVNHPPPPRKKVAKSTAVLAVKPPPPAAPGRQKGGANQPNAVWILKHRLPPPHSKHYYFSPSLSLLHPPPSPRFIPEETNATSVKVPAAQLLSNEQSQHLDCWHHKYAATACLHQTAFPFGVYRLMGTITRDSVCLRKSTSTKSSTTPALYPGRQERTPRSISNGTALRLARQEWENQSTSERSPEDPALQTRALAIQREWEHLLTLPPLPGACPWNREGVLLSFANDPTFMNPIVLLRRLEQGGDEDDTEDFRDILKACQDLLDPRQLWKIPVLQVFPVVTPIAAASGGRGHKQQRQFYSVHMAVYMHRLLPEMNSTSLRRILQGLDEGSYRCTRPSVTIPQLPVFASNPHPKVVTNEEDVVMLDELQQNEEDERANNSDCGDDDDDDDDDDGDEEDETKKRDAKAEAEVTEKISAFSAEGLLKLLEHTGTDLTDYEQRYAPRLEPFLRLQLLPYQQHGVAWMIQMEALDSINDLLWEEREFWDASGCRGTYYCCPALGQIRLERPAQLKGGLVCDRMGLGKTIEVLGLILATLDERKAAAHGDGTNHATLIIVPPALVAQWVAEIEKCVGNDGILTVDYYDFRTMTVERRLGSAGAAADIVITTYHALETTAKAKYLIDTHWARIVLDEMQEIRSSTTMIARICEKLSGDRRWMMSGTPLFDGIDDFRGELNFLKLSPFAASNEDGFFKFMIGTPWDNREIDAIERLQVLSAILLRRSKDMTVVATGRPLLDHLPPLTVEFVPVQPTDAERALYYYMEWIAGSETSTVEASKKYTQKRLCLRLLRELCISPILLNGGMGASSQLKTLNTLLIAQARRRGQGVAIARDTTGTKRDLSCDEAILHLAELQEAARCGGQVAAISLGFGQGLSRRVRAADVETLQALEETESKAKKTLVVARCARARARWHWAVEHITTGQVAHLVPSSPNATEIRSLWLLRRAVVLSLAKYEREVPDIFRRGWRPTEQLMGMLPFPWAKQGSLRLEGIPLDITSDSVAAALDRVVGSESNTFEIVASNKDDTCWSAYVMFPNATVADKVMDQAQRAKGILLENDAESPAVVALISKAQEAYNRAAQTSSLQPSAANVELRKAAKRALNLAKSGVYASKNGGVGQVSIGSACDPIRLLENQGNTRITMIHLESEIERQTAAIVDASQELQRCASRVSHLNKSVNGLSAVESLQALSDGDHDKTSCCICLDVLGTTKDEPAHDANISLTKCGHLYCRKCLRDCLNQHGFANTNCPACRRPLSYRDDVVHINPSLKEDETNKEEHRGIVEEALELLSQKHGLLPPTMWHHLFKSIELPSFVMRSRMAQCSAIPGDVLAHLRSLFGDKLSPKKSFVPTELTGTSNWLSSKVNALLRDLPKDERSLVFATARSTIEHLSSVFTALGIGHRMLCSGQNVNDTEQAIVEWQSTNTDGVPDVPVLLVQSGAAASGVTLTAACKMFLMEPFPRFSEEQQAFGRCHRIGQEYPVHAKVYYTPVSVESRLLDWRQNTSKSEKDSRDTKVIYATLDSEDEDDPADFLLGVNPQHDAGNES